MFAAVVVVDLCYINFNTLPARIYHRLFTLKPEAEIMKKCPEELQKAKINNLLLYSKRSQHVF
jgi:hypothetical protein